jgi:hypothetical protein
MASITITIPFLGDDSIAVLVGSRVRIETDPYDNPLPTEGIITGVRVEKRRIIEAGQGPFYVIVKVQQGGGDASDREFDVEEAHIEKLAEP